VAGDQLVKRIDEPPCPDSSKDASQRSGEPQLGEQCDAAARVARNESSILQDDPPAVVPPFLGHVDQQENSRVVVERQKSKLMPTIESRDDTRREPAELSGARVEESRAHED
jgi:hypothetical protein